MENPIIYEYKKGMQCLIAGNYNIVYYYTPISYSFLKAHDFRSMSEINAFSQGLFPSQWCSWCCRKAAAPWWEGPLL